MPAAMARVLGLALEGISEAPDAVRYFQGVDVGAELAPLAGALREHFGERPVNL